MSVFGEEILNRLPTHSKLTKNNIVGRLIDLGVGGLLDSLYEEFTVDRFFVNTANGKHLDLLGKQYNVIRNTDESDADYRERISYELLSHLTLNYLIEIYNLDLYCFVEDFNAEDNMLTSNNLYLPFDYMTYRNDELEKIVKSKLVLGSDIKWVIQ